MEGARRGLADELVPLTDEAAGDECGLDGRRTGQHRDREASLEGGRDEGVAVDVAAEASPAALARQVDPAAVGFGQQGNLLGGEPEEPVDDPEGRPTVMDLVNLPMRLYPVYRELGELQGRTDSAEKDLFFPDLSMPAPEHPEPAA